LGVFSGDTAAGATINGVLEYVLGLASGTIVNAGVEVVIPVGVARGATVNGGPQIVYGTASGTIANRGGYEQVEAAV
jgi:autotransporter passenger strand-loop-strand repeat protein